MSSSPAGAPKGLFFEDLTIGMTESLSHKVEDKDIVAFADLSGDHNPIHLSDDYAKTTRFGARIAHGLYTASLFSALIGMKLPGPGAVYLSQTLHFKAPVKLGDEVTVSVEVTELVAKGRRCKLRCDAKVGGALVLEGEALVMVPSREPKPAA